MAPLFLMFGLFFGFARADDPEANMTAPEIIAFWGYPVEVMPAITSDGYILNMHRIPHGRNNSNFDKKRPIIFLQHGLELSSWAWITNLPSQSFGKSNFSINSQAFIAADMGFDVWLGNMRGNAYGLDHVQLNSTVDKEFWAFSWDAMTKCDLDAMINKVLEVTNNTQLYYVGHSQGTLTMFSKLAVDAEFNRKVGQRDKLDGLRFENSFPSHRLASQTTQKVSLGSR